ncbi:MAG: site-2 protease family protein [Treponema sp.]|nr:site-2 protease family protein [Treponema sp.]
MNVQNILFSLPGIIIGLTVHEFCHAMAAYKLGDSTAKSQGRITINPLRHIDPIGFLFIIFAGFGWARPVQFNPYNLRHLRRDKAIIAAAGPLSNFALALIFIGIVRLWLMLAQSPTIAPAALDIVRSGVSLRIIQTFIRAAVINFGLFVFNLFPIPPLDGSHIAFSGLNISMEIQQRIMKIAMPLLFIIIIIQNQTNITILPIRPIVFALLHFFLPQLS